MRPRFHITFDIENLANCLEINKDEVLEYFRDGRRVSFILERRIARRINATLAKSEGASFDLRDNEGLKWEVRSISKGGIYFCPSYMVGKGRHFEESGFLEKLEEIQGYIVSDIQIFPDIPVWFIQADLVSQWWNEHRLGTTTKISRARALDLLRYAE